MSALGPWPACSGPLTPPAAGRVEMCSQEWPSRAAQAPWRVGGAWGPAPRLCSLSGSPVLSWAWGIQGEKDKTSTSSWSVGGGSASNSLSRVEVIATTDRGGHRDRGGGLREPEVGSHRTQPGWRRGRREGRKIGEGKSCLLLQGRALTMERQVPAWALRGGE